MKTLNLGIVAHVDAGKTSLTERLLHTAGVIDEIGSVDAGSTQTDSLALERQRGITIKSAVVSFLLGDLSVNLIDTPGHPDFIAEVERVLSVLDGAVLVLSAVEGVQSQTRILMRTLRRLGIPTLVFVNKIDRAGAREAGVLAEIAARMTPAVVAMGSTEAIGTREARFVRRALDGRTDSLVDLLADHDDAFLADYVTTGSALPEERLRAELAAQTARALVHPVFFGSAITGAGITELVEGIRALLPPASGDADAGSRGSVFKVERGSGGDKIAYVRMFDGALHVRDRIEHGPGRSGKITAIEVFDQGGTVRSATVQAGQIARLWGLADVRIGDAVGGRGVGGRAAGAEEHVFAPPTLETVVVPDRASDRGSLHAALVQLAEQDPLIDLQREDVQQEVSVSLYGEVQKEVIQATLAADYGIGVSFRETTTICVERLGGSGAAVELMGQEGNPFLATVGLRVDPASVGTGVEFRLEVELGSMPYAFFKAVEDTVRATLRHGLSGWEVSDCVVTYTHSGYAPRQSHAHATFDKSMSSTGGDFRLLTPLVLFDALRRAGTAVQEPMHQFRLEAPADTLSALLPVLGRMRATVGSPGLAEAICILEGTMPAARVHELQQRLPELTRGEGVLESSFSHHQAVRGPAPRRPRPAPDPADRKGYLLQVERRVSVG